MPHERVIEVPAMSVAEVFNLHLMECATWEDLPPTKKSTFYRRFQDLKEGGGLRLRLHRTFKTCPTCLEWSDAIALVADKVKRMELTMG